MGIHNLPQIIPQLLAGGMSLDTPVTLIRWRTRPEQTELIGTLKNYCRRHCRIRIYRPSDRRNW